MADLPNLDAVRAALEARKRGRWDDIALADALAAVDLLTAQLATAEAAGRRKGLEEAAGVCEEWADRFNDSTACLLCADYIRSLVPSGAK